MIQLVYRVLDRHFEELFPAVMPFKAGRTQEVK